MKCQVPQISWHSRDPVLSIDFQPGKRNIQRLASAGTDSHVLIWYITYQENKSIKIECASDLYRHNKPVNVVRWSPDGEFLVSGDDEGAMFVWQLKEQELQDGPKDEENINQEDWHTLKLLRGHLEDIYDISWSADGNFLVSASMDNTCIIWDMQKFQKIHILSDSKGYLQGVAWDPLNSYIASMSSDRALRIYNINTKKTMYRIQRAPWTVKTERGAIKARLFFDDTLTSYFRRLSFTPDGELLIVPSGILEREEEKFQNTTYIFSRHAPNKPAIQLPTGDKYTVAVRCNPLLYKLRGANRESDNKENQPKTKPMIDLPYRMVFAVAACDSVLLYDTEQLLPFAYVSNIHYTHLTDLSWSPDGRILVASSTDGYCSFLVFADDELGEIYVPPKEEVMTESNTGDKTTSVPVEKTTSVPVEKTIPVNAVENKPAEKTEPVSVPIVVNDTNVMSPKISESPVNASKSNRKPKVTIKNFFTSPKPKPASLFSNSGSSKENSDKKQDDKASVKGTSSAQAPAAKSSVVGNDQPMEVDNDDSVEVVFDAKGPAATKDKKIQLFGKSAPESVDNKPSNVTTTETLVEADLSNGNAVLSFEDSLEKVENAGKIQEDNDWKLELSQDDEPMEVSEPVPSTSSGPSKIPVTPTTPKTPDQKTKRRISLITLSSKSSLKSPKSNK